MLLFDILTFVKGCVIGEMHLGKPLFHGEMHLKSVVYDSNDIGIAISIVEYGCFYYYYC